MHSNDQDSDRITEFTLHDHDYGQETHFVGDSQTARSIDRLYALIEERLPKPPTPTEPTAAEKLAELNDYMNAEFTAIGVRIDHIDGKHDYSRVEGCPSCETRRAA